MSRVLLLTATVITALAFVPSAPAQEPPTPGTTTTTVCRFEPSSELLDPGITLCNLHTVTIIKGSCFEGERLYETDEIFEARHYRGNVILPGLNGVEVEGTYSDVVRPHARLIFEGGGAFSFTQPFPDPSCT